MLVHTGGIRWGIGIGVFLKGEGRKGVDDADATCKVSPTQQHSKPLMCEEVAQV